MARPRGATKTTSGARAGDAEKALLRAAIREFAEKGFDGATTAGIARRAGVSQPLVHHHFGSKEGLFRVVLDTLFEKLERAVLGEDDESEVVEARVRKFVRFTAKHPELARIWLIESTKGGERADYILDRHLEPFVRRVAPIVESAIGGGALPRVDPMMLVYALQGIASYPFLVPAQVRRLSRADPRSEAFASSYAELVVALVFAAKARGAPIESG